MAFGQFGEVEKMKKDKEWLKKKFDEVVEFRKESNPSSSWGMGSNTVLKYIKEDFKNLIDQLDETEVKQLDKKTRELESYNDELIRDNNQLRNTLDNQEVLSQEWIDEHAQGGCDEWVYIEDLQNLLVPKQEKPVIPQFVADYIEKWEHEGMAMSEWLYLRYDNEEEDEVSKWLYDNNYEENRRREYLLIDALRYGYEVAKEKKYYAKIKGHELIQRIQTFDEDTGENTSDYYRSIYFVLQSDGDLIVDMKDSCLSGAKNVMTMSQWNNLGINETNADFEEIE